MNKKILIASLVTLASVAGVVGTVGNAHKVEAVDHSGGDIYFDNSITKWTDNKIMLLIGHDSYTSVYEMKKIDGTNLYYHSMPTWGGANYCAIIGASSIWGSGSWGPSNRTNATHYTNVYKNYGFNSGSTYSIVPSGASNDSNISITYHSEGRDFYSNIDLYATSYVLEENEYVASKVGGSVKISAYYMGSHGEAVMSTATGEEPEVNYYDAIKTSNVTFTAVEEDGYEFVGWFSEANGGTLVSDLSVYEISNNLENQTLHARFDKIVSEEPEELSALFSRYYNDGSYTKDSVLNVNSSTMSEVAKYFHASQAVRYRKTVYTPTGLTMTTSDDGVTYVKESTYTNGDGNVIHTGEGGNFTVNQPSVEDWFVTLKDFKDSTIEGWTYADGVYSHNLVETTATTEDTLTKMAREFVAPMWLAPNAENYNYVTFSKLTVEEVDNQLVMKLYVKEDNSGQLIEGSDLVFSQVTIY